MSIIKPDTTSEELAASDSTAAALGFALRLESGRALLELKDRALGGGLHLERLEMEIPNVRFPFDVSGGAERFRSQRCDLRTLVLKVSNETLAKWLHRPALGEAGFRELELVHDEGSLFCSGRFEHGAHDVRFSFRFAPIILTPRALLLFFFDERVYGTLDLPAPRLPLMILEGLGMLPRTGSVPAYDVVELAVRRLLPAHGWKIPNTSEVGLVSADAAKSGLVAAAGVNLVTQHSTNLRVSLAFDQRAPFEECEEALYKGDDAAAFARVRGAVNAEIPAPFAVRRLLQLAAANEQWLEEGRSVAEEALAHDADDIDAHHFLAQLAQREGDLNEAARRYAMAAERAWALGDERVAALDDVTAAGLARHGLRDLAKACLQRTLARRRHDSRALQLAFALAIEDKANHEASELGERLLRVLPEGDRFDVHLRLGRLFLGRDLKKAKVHAERALRANMESETALRLVADVYAEQGDVARAMRTYSRLAERAAARGASGDALQLELKLVTLIEASGSEQPRALLTRLQRILQIDPGQREAMRRAARLAFELDEGALAKRYYQELLNGGDEALVAEASYALGTLALREGRPLEAELFYETAATGAGHQDAYRALLRVYEERNDQRAQYRLEDLLSKRARTPSAAVDHHLRAANVALLLSDQKSCLDHLNTGLEIAPDHRLIKRRLFEVLGELGPSQGKAQMLLRWARAEHEPEMRSEWFVALAGVLEGLGKEDEAKEALKEAVKADPGAVEANEALFALCQRLHDPYGAFEALGNIARHRPSTDETKAELRITQAELLAGPLQRQDEARAYLLRALVDAPHHVRGLWLLADLSERAGDRETAIPAYERYLETGDPDHRLVALDKVADAALNANELGKANELLRVLWRESRNPRVLDRLMGVLRQRGEFGTVADLLRDAAREADPVTREQLVWQTAEMLRDSVGDWQAARQELEQIADRPSDLGAKARAALIQLAQEEGRLDLTAGALVRALEFASSREEKLHLSLTLARTRRELSESALAAEAYESVLALDPHDSEALGYVAEEAERLGDSDEAFRHWLRLTVREPLLAWPRLAELVAVVDIAELTGLLTQAERLPRAVAQAVADRFAAENDPDNALLALGKTDIARDDESYLPWMLQIAGLEETQLQRPDLALQRVQAEVARLGEAAPLVLSDTFERLVERAGTPLMQAEQALRRASSSSESLAAVARLLALDPQHKAANQTLDHHLDAPEGSAWLQALPEAHLSLERWATVLHEVDQRVGLGPALQERLGHTLRSLERVAESNAHFAALWLNQPDELTRLEEWLEGIEPGGLVEAVLGAVHDSPTARASLARLVAEGELQNSFGVDFAMALMAELGDSVTLPFATRRDLAAWLHARQPQRAEPLLAALVREQPSAELLILWLGERTKEAQTQALTALPSNAALIDALSALDDAHRGLRFVGLRAFSELLSPSERLQLAKDARSEGDEGVARQQFERIYLDSLDEHVLHEWLQGDSAAAATFGGLLARIEDREQGRTILQQGLSDFDDRARLDLLNDASERDWLDDEQLISLAKEEQRHGLVARAHQRYGVLVERRPNDEELAQAWVESVEGIEHRRLALRRYEWQRQQLLTEGTPHEQAEHLARAVEAGLFDEPMASQVRKAFLDAGSPIRALQWAKRATAERPADVAEWRERARIALELAQPEEVLATTDALADVASMDGEALQDFRWLRAEELLARNFVAAGETLLVEVLEADPTHTAAFAALRELWSERPKDLLGFARRRALFLHEDGPAVRDWFDLAKHADAGDEQLDAIAALASVGAGALITPEILHTAFSLAVADASKLDRVWDYAEELVVDFDDDTRRALAHLCLNARAGNSAAADLADALLLACKELDDDELEFLARRRLHANQAESALQLLHDRRSDLAQSAHAMQALWLELATATNRTSEREQAVAALGRGPDASLEVKLELVNIHRERGQASAALSLVQELLTDGSLTNAARADLVATERELIEARARGALTTDPARALVDAKYLLKQHADSAEVQSLAVAAALAAKDDDALLDFIAGSPASTALTLLAAEALERQGKHAAAGDKRLSVLDAVEDRGAALGAALDSFERAGELERVLSLRLEHDAELDELEQPRWLKTFELAEKLGHDEEVVTLARRLFEADPADEEHRDRLLRVLSGERDDSKHIEVWIEHLQAVSDPVDATLEYVRGLLARNAATAAKNVLDTVLGDNQDAIIQQVRLDIADAQGDHDHAYELLSAELDEARGERRSHLLDRLETLAVQLGRAQAAAQHFAEGFTLAPTLERWRRFATHESALGEIDVKPLLEAAVGVVDDAAKTDLYERLAELAEDRGQTSEALGYYQKAHALAPDNDSFNAQISRLHENSGDVHGLVDHLARQHSASLDRKERFELAMRIAGLCADRLGDGDQAELFYRQAVKDDPDQRAPHDALLKLYERRHANDALMGTLEALITLTQDPGERAGLAQRLGDLRLEKNDTKGAAAAYLYVLREGRSSPGLRKVVVAEAQQGHLARETLSELIAIAKGGELEERAAAFADAAVVAASLQDYEQASALAQSGFEITTPKFEAVNQALDWAQKANLGEQSLALLERMIDVTDNRGELIALHQRRAETARELGRNEVAIDAELELFRMSALDPDQSLGLAQALARAGQNDESSFVLKALVRQPLTAEQKNALREAFAALGDDEMVVQLLVQTTGDPLERGAALCDAARLCIDKLHDADRGYQLYCEALAEDVAISEQDLSTILALAEGRGDDDTLSAIYLRIAESEGPKDKRAQAYAAMAKFWLQRGETARSEDCLRAALKLSPDDVAIKRRLADLFLADNRLEDAAPLLGTLEPPEDATPERRSAWLKVAAEAALRANDDQRALSLLERAALEDDEALFRAYDMRERRGEKHLALMLVLERLDRPEPARVEATRWQRAARLAVELRDSEGELRLLRHLAHQGTLDGLGMARLAALYELQGDNAGAIQWILKRAASLAGVERATALLQASKLAIEIKDGERARDLLNEAFDVAPSHAATLEALYDGFTKVGDKERALVVGERLVLLSPQHPFRDDFHIKLAESAEQVGDARRALDLWSLAHQRRPLDRGQLDHVTRLAESKAPDLALDWRERALTASGGTAEDYARLARDARERVGDAKRAERLLDKARGMAPHDESYLRAFVETLLTDRTALPEAVRLYRDFVDQHPLEVEAWRTLARLFGQQNDVDRTFVAYDALLALAPDDAEATQFVSAARTLLPELPIRALAPTELSELADQELLSPLQSFYSPLSPQAELLYPSDLSRLGLTEQNRLPRDQGFGRRLSLIQQAMGGRATEIQVYLATSASLDAVVEPGAPPKLVVGADVPNANNRVAQFIVGRALAVLSFGHLLPSRLPRPDITTLLNLLVRRFVPTVTVAGIDEARVEGFLARFRVVTPEDVWGGHSAAAEQVARELIATGRLAAELDTWIAAGQAAADRWGLLLAGELQAVFSAPKLVGQTLVAPPPLGPDRIAALHAREDLKSLLRFAVSDRYAKLRAAIGWTVRR